MVEIKMNICITIKFTNHSASNQSYVLHCSCLIGVVVMLPFLSGIIIMILIFNTCIMYVCIRICFYSRMHKLVVVVRLKLWLGPLFLLQR